MNNRGACLRNRLQAYFISLLLLLSAGCGSRIESESAKKQEPRLAELEEKLQEQQTQIELLKRKIADSAQAEAAGKAQHRPALSGRVAYKTKDGRVQKDLVRTIYLCSPGLASQLKELYEPHLKDLVWLKQVRDSIAEMRGKTESVEDTFGQIIRTLESAAKTVDPPSFLTNGEGEFSVDKLPQGETYVFAPFHGTGAVGFWLVAAGSYCGDPIVLDLSNSNITLVFED